MDASDRLIVGPDAQTIASGHHFTKCLATRVHGVMATAVLQFVASRRQLERAAVAATAAELVGDLGKPLGIAALPRDIQFVSIPGQLRNQLGQHVCGERLAVATDPAGPGLVDDRQVTRMQGWRCSGEICT